MSFYVYILRCADGSYYIGHTDDLEERLSEQERGGVTVYTRKRRPVVLVFSADFYTREGAIDRERQIKGWSRAKRRR